MAQTATYMRRVLIKMSPTVTGPAGQAFCGDYTIEERCCAIEESAAMFESKVKCAEDVKTSVRRLPSIHSEKFAESADSQQAWVDMLPQRVMLTSQRN